MLERLRIRRFRGFDDLEIEKLSRINLVAGANNAGKTTLLEAIFLLGAGGNPRLALNRHVVRTMEPSASMPRSISETLWRPLFFRLDTDGGIAISGHHSSVGEIKVRITLGRPPTTEVSRAADDGKLMSERDGERSLKFMYTDSNAGQIENEARETAENVAFDQKEDYVPFSGTIVQPGGGNIHEDAIRLGRLRKQKRGDMLLLALRSLEPRLQGIEDNASSGAPLIWVDVGLSELVPLAVVGAGMTHFTRIVLAATSVPGGVVLVDEIENGLHHSVLPDMWRVIAKTAEQFDVQVFATTHSFECIEAAHEGLGPDGFGLHRLETVEGVTRCVTYGPGAIEGAIRHNMEVR